MNFVFSDSNFLFPISYFPVSHPLPSAWRQERPAITESLAEFISRKTQSDDLFELPRSRLEWELLWLKNELMATGDWTGTPPERAEKLFAMGKQFAWQSDDYLPFGVFLHILRFVGLEIVDPSVIV